MWWWWHLSLWVCVQWWVPLPFLPQASIWQKGRLLTLMCMVTEDLNWPELFPEHPQGCHSPEIAHHWPCCLNPTAAYETQPRRRLMTVWFADCWVWRGINVALGNAGAVQRQWGMHHCAAGCCASVGGGDDMGQNGLHPTATIQSLPY